MVIVASPPTGVIRLYTGQRTSSWWVRWVLGAYLELYCPNKRDQIRKSGVCWHGVAKKTKIKDVLWRSTSDQSDRLACKPASCFVSAFDVRHCKKLKLQISPSHTLSWPAMCCLSSPCEWTIAAHLLRWRTWRDIEVIHALGENERRARWWKWDCQLKNSESHLD